MTAGAGQARDFSFRLKGHHLHLFMLLLVPLTTQADYQAGLDAYLLEDYSTAMNEWQTVAEGPPASTNRAIYAETHYAIAMLYWLGQGVTRNYYTAYEWLQKAAELNHAGAMAKLGFLYTEGISVPQDFDRAFAWYTKAGRMGDVDGQYNLGIFYLNGWGTERDTTMAKQYFAAASAQGDTAAEEALQSLIQPVGAGHARDFVSSEEESRAWPAPTIADESWILAQNPAHYTIQVIGLSSRSKVELLVMDHEDLAPFAVYSVQHDTRPIHVLIQGVYPSVEAAREARDLFPNEINPPDRLWIRQLVQVQQLIRLEQE